MPTSSPSLGVSSSVVRSCHLGMRAHHGGGDDARPVGPA